MPLAEYKSLWALKKNKFCQVALSIQTLITALLCGICAQQNQLKRFLSRQKNIQEQALRILYNSFSSDFESILLNKCGKPTMEVKQLRTLALEVFKTLNI